MLPDWQVTSPAPKKLVVEAVVANRFVVVAEVVVDLVTMTSVRPLSVVKLFRVLVAARLVSKRVSKRPLKVLVYTPPVTVPALPEMEPVMI
jgi:hypothetical protein